MESKNVQMYCLSSRELFKFIILVVSLLLSSVLLNAQVALQELQDYYNKKEYQKIISHAEQLKNTTDTSVLYIIAESYWKQAIVEQDKADKSYQQMLKSSLNAVYLGIGSSADVNMVGIAYQRMIDEISKLKMKAVDFYSKAALLGDSNAMRTLKIISLVFGIYNPMIDQSNFQTYSSPGNSTSKTPQNKCSFCKGTGKVAGEVTTYGSGVDYWCSTCQKTVPASHCCQCKVCPSCNGRGYNPY